MRYFARHRNVHGVINGTLLYNLHDGQFYRFFVSMHALSLATSFRETVSSWGLLLIWLIFLASLIWAFHDQSELGERWTRAHGRERKRVVCKIVLVWAIPLITLIAGISSYWDSQITDEKLDEAEKKIAAQSPRKQPIVSVTASVRFTVSGTNFTQSNPLQTCSRLLWGRSPTNSLLWAVSLGITSFERYGSEFLLEYGGQDPMFRLMGLVNADGQLIEKSDEWDRVLLCAFFLPENSEILDGSITFTINSSAQKKFPIPHQKPSRPVITCIITNGVASMWDAGQGGLGWSEPLKVKGAVLGL